MTARPSYEDLGDPAKMAAWHRALAEEFIIELRKISPQIAKWATVRANEGFTADAIRHALQEQQRQAKLILNSRGMRS